MSVEETYNTWLTEKLKNFEIDHEVFGTYISSVIISDEADAEKRETVRDILLDCTHDVDISALCDEIIEKWYELHKKFVSKNEETAEEVDLAHKVALIMEKQVQPVLKIANRSSDEEKIREAILSRCRFVSSDEEEDESDGAGVSTMPHSTFQNQNVETVLQAEKEKRDNLKLESDKKKAQCKVSREKQKQKQEERKEKERKRTQKREHKR